jgi:hypothetical protein
LMRQPGCSVRRSAIYRSAESDSSDKTRLTQRSTLHGRVNPIAIKLRRYELI